MSEEIKTFRDLITLGAKAAGIDVQDKSFAEYIQNDAFGTPIRGAYINDFEDIIYKVGKTDPRIEKHFKDEIGGKTHGTFAAMSERAFRQKAQEFGFDTTMLDKLIEDTKGQDFMPRWKGIADFFFLGGQKAGEKSAKTDRGDEAMKLEIKQLQSQLDSEKKAREAEAKEWESKLTEGQKALQNLSTMHALDREVRKQIKFKSAYSPKAVDSLIGAGLREITSKYNIINKNGEFVPFDKDNPANVAENPENGRPLTLNDVLAAHFPEEDRQTQPEGGGGGGTRTPIVPKVEDIDPKFAHLHKWAENQKMPEPKR